MNHSSLDCIVISSQLSAGLGLRHVGYGIPTEMFSPCPASYGGDTVGCGKTRGKPWENLGN